MNEEILQCAPQTLWQHFEELNAVPRPSKKEERVIEFMKQFGEGLGLETIVDSAGNVVIRKPASPGMEDRVGVIMQGHLDMVHQKNAATDFDFATQGIQSFVEGEWLKARGTTLGSDNGVGVASIMAVLSSKDIKHGPFEGLFTIDEETGMTGAFKLEPGILQGNVLLNTDTEDEGELCIGCAGGIDTTVQWGFTAEAADSADTAIEVSVTGLQGGHSGCDIHLGRGNANKIMNRLLWSVSQTVPFRIARIDGGSLRNAIPRESFALVSVAADQLDAFLTSVQEHAVVISREIALAEGDLKIAAKKSESSEALSLLPVELQQQLLSSIYAVPNGVYRMSDAVPGLVETSTSMARVLADTQAGKVEVMFLTRSSSDSSKQDLSQCLEAAFTMAGATVEHTGSYPGWEPNADSKVLDLMRGLYQELFNKEAHVSAVHAGLECGIIGSIYPNLDMISFGPTIKNPHSPDEKCHIGSVEKYWQFLLATLERI